MASSRTALQIVDLGFGPRHDRPPRSRFGGSFEPPPSLVEQLVPVLCFLGAGELHEPASFEVVHLGTLAAHELLQVVYLGSHLHIVGRLAGDLK